MNELVRTAWRKLTRGVDAWQVARGDVVDDTNAAGVAALVLAEVLKLPPRLDEIPSASSAWPTAAFRIVCPRRFGQGRRMSLYRWSICCAGWPRSARHRGFIPCASTDCSRRRAVIALMPAHGHPVTRPNRPTLTAMLPGHRLRTACAAFVDCWVQSL